MRKTGLHLAGLAVALVGAAAKDALAADISISTATTTPVQTSSPDPQNPGPGNVTVAVGGSITVGANQSAVTVNSNNNVTNNGTLASTASGVNNVTGVLIQNGFTGNVFNSGAINLLEDYTMVDADPKDGDFDGPWAQGEGRNGIWLQAGAGHTGTITLSPTGAINIEGNNSTGIRLDARLTGDIVSNGGFALVGDFNRAIAINGGATAGVTGDVSVLGAINMRGQGAIGVLVDAPIGGQLALNGTWNISGYHSIAHPTLQATIDALDADDLLQSGSAVAVHYSVAEGVVVRGVGVEDDEDDDGDGDTEAEGDPNDDATANISVYSSAPVIWIAPSASAPATLTLGNTGSGYGFHNRGILAANGVYNGFDATGLRIEGVGGADVNVFGGVLNDGGISVTAYEAESYGIYLGDGANVPTVNNRTTITSRTIAETDQTSYGIYLGAGANTQTLNNSGLISTQLVGEVGDSVAVRDASGSLTSIINSGTIQAAILPTDDDLTDDEFPEITGDMIAIDVSANTTGVTLQQVAATVFTDDDSTDNDAGNRPPVRIIGDVLFGSGGDTFSLLAGQVIGDIAFGDGADTLTMDNEAFFVGKITDTDGQLTLNIQEARLGIGAGTLNITSATFGAESELGIILDTNPANSTRIIASGQVSFAAGATIVPVIPAGLPDSGSHVFLTANGGLVGGANVARTVTGTGAPYLYNVAIGIDDADVNSLEASYVLKTTNELGLDSNETAAFTPILNALRGSSAASAAFANLTGETEFFDAYQDLLPNYAGATAELAAMAINQGQSATTNRLASTRLRDLDEVSVWAQEIGYGLEREPESFGVAYRGSGFGIATGIDGPLDNGALFGLSASFIASEAEEPGRVDGEISASFGQLNAYFGTAVGPIDLDIVAGGGAGKMRSRRFVAIGPDFESISEAEWWAYEGHGAIRASAPMRSGWFVMTPQAALSYVAISEEGYEEEGGGTIDYEVDETVSQRLWADVGVEFGARFRRGAETQIAPRAFVGYRANVLDEAAERTVRFVSGTQDFTLIDEELGSGGPLVGLGFDATNGPSTFSISYEGEFGDQITRHSLNASLRFRF